jgi:murein DD-endopeptidase MepM/ murein hydrolase activator NlpD
MTLGFFLLTSGLVLLAAGLKGATIADVLQGIVSGDKPIANPKVYGSASSSDASGPPGAMGPGGATPGGWPTKHAKIIGTPYTGTHTLGNWQSDRAVDIAVPKGTPVYAVVGGKVTRAGKLPGNLGARFTGLRVQLGDEEWFGHLSRLVVRAGQTVAPGQLIGYSGEANGVEHLHYARRTGGLPG